MPKKQAKKKPPQKPPVAAITPKPKPKPAPLDYQTLVEEGTFDGGNPLFRVVVILNGSRKDEFLGEKVNVGFGATPKEAIDDFIRRNTSSLLDKVFDLK